MIQSIAQFKNYLRLLKLRRDSKKPTKLPVGLKEFNQFCDDIIELSGEYADRDSMVYAIASNIIHIKHDCDEVPKEYFVRTLRKAAANQVASAIFTEIKERHDKAKAEDQAHSQPASSSQTPESNLGKEEV